MHFQIVSEEKPLPTSWEEFDVIQALKKGTAAHQLGLVKAINSFCLVPGAPVIAAGPGISSEYRNYRLFLISRKEDLTKKGEEGRCAILLSNEKLDSELFRTFSYFIPEETAQIILKQIEGFDPPKQPVAFEDISRFEKSENERLDFARSGRKALPFDNSGESSIFNLPSGHAVTIWLFGGLLIVCLAVVYIFFNRRQVD